MCQLRLAHALASPPFPSHAVASCFIKVNNPPYLTSLDLWGEIDDDTARVSYDESGEKLIVEAKKASEGLWNGLLFKGTKAEAETRRNAAVQARMDKNAKVRARA